MDPDEQLGPRDIVDFAEQHRKRVYKKIEDEDVTWLQAKLVKDIAPFGDAQVW